jgi:hypothetical protein
MSRGPQTSICANVADKLKGKRNQSEKKKKRVVSSNTFSMSPGVHT